MFWTILLLSNLALAEEKYPRKILAEMEIISCRGGNGDRQDVTAKVNREKEVFLYKLQQEHKWVPKNMIDPKPYVILNTVKTSCDQLVAKKLVILERAQKSEDCKKKPTSHWWCRHEVFNLLTYPPWLNEYK